MKAKKRKIVILLFLILFFVFACSTDGKEDEVSEADIESRELEIIFHQISASMAKEIMDNKESFVLLDVRNEEEFVEGHIEGALLIPVNQIVDLAPNVIPNKEVLILVYCRSGRRSVEAAQMLMDLGYTQVYEFGGIIDWPYQIVRE